MHKKVTNTYFFSKFYDDKIKWSVSEIEETESKKIIKTAKVLAGTNKSGFFGSLPVKLDFTNINSITGKSYVVAPRPNGKNYLMLIKNRGEIFMISENDHVFRVENMNFSQLKDIKNCILDGILTESKHRGGNLRFVITDAISYEGQQMKIPYEIRMQFIRNEIILPHNIVVPTQNPLLSEPEPFDIEQLDICEVTGENLEKIIAEEYLKNKDFRPDGLFARLESE